MQASYNEYIGKMLSEIPFGVPIFTDNIVNGLSYKTGLPRKEIKSVVNLNLKRYADENVIERIQKGIYYKPKTTVFGKTKPPVDLAITQICIRNEDETIGYIGAETLLNNIGLSTLLPKNKVIVTNKYRTKIQDDMNIILKKPVIPINNDNFKYLQIIDAISMMGNSVIDADNPNKVIERFIDKNEIDKLKLLKYAKRYYSNKVLLKTLDIILEEDDEFTLR